MLSYTESQKQFFRYSSASADQVKTISDIIILGQICVVCVVFHLTFFLFVGSIGWLHVHVFNFLVFIIRGPKHSRAEDLPSQQE